MLSAVFLNKLSPHVSELDVHVTASDVSRRKDACGTPLEALEKALRYAVRAFVIGYGGKTIFTVLFQVIKRPGYPVPIHLFLSKDTAKFGTSIGLVVGIYKCLLVFLRQRRHLLRSGVSGHAKLPAVATLPIGQTTERTSAVRVSSQVPKAKLNQARALVEERASDKIDRAVAGAISGLGLAANNRDYRIFASKYMLVRSLDLIRNTGERLQWWPRLPRLSYSLFGLINGPIMYSFLCNPKLLSSSYYKWILWMGNIKDGDLDKMIRVYIRESRPNKLNPCEGFLYPKSSTRLYLLWDWVLGLGRASSVYLPVHLMPLLLFKVKTLIADPKFQLLRLAKNVSLSCMFLSSYQTIVKMSAMGILEASRTIYPFTFLLTGFATTAACEFERQSRVNELMLYCATHTLDVLWNFLVSKGLVVSVAYGELLPFMLACSITFSTDPADFKPAYRSLLSFLVPEEV